MPTVSYPLDTTGLSTANKVPNESHTLTEVNDATYRILIPDFAPFYLDNCKLVHVDTLGVQRELARDIDFVFTIPYLSASSSTRKMLYGGWSINSLLLNGTILATYQTLGGEDNAYVPFVRERLHEAALNPRSASWEVITNKPYIFPPSDHEHPFSDLADSQALIDAILEIPEAIAAGPNPSNGYVSHLVDENNPHETTKQQVGLGNVANLAWASDQEVTQRARVDKYVTLKQVLNLLQSLGINTA